MGANRQTKQRSIFVEALRGCIAKHGPVAQIVWGEVGGETNIGFADGFTLCSLCNRRMSLEQMSELLGGDMQSVFTCLEIVGRIPKTSATEFSTPTT